MKKGFFLGLVFILCIALVPTHSQEKTGETKMLQFKTESAPQVILKRRELTLRQRRQLGLTVTNIQIAVKELKESGEIDDSTSVSEAAVIVAERLQSKNKVGYAGVGIDWDAIIAFIEMILKLIGMFS